MGAHSCCRRIFPLTGRQLAFQEKVKLTHSVVSGVVVPHGCEDLTDRAEVLLYRSLLDILPLHRQKSGLDTLGENLEEGNGVLNVLEVGGYFRLAAEASPLVPGGGVFLEDGGQKTLGDCLLSSIVVSCRL